MILKFNGAAREVTGSCFHLSRNGLQMLVDCGMHQGIGAEDRNRNPFPFRPEAIDYLFLTHAHIDHSGLIPKLVKDGFRGRIITTPATADLARVLLADSANIQEKDAEWETKKILRTGERVTVKPLYTAEDAAASLPLFDRVPYGRIERLRDGVRYRFTDAGHILGSGTIELWYRSGNGEKKIVFSGDIGKKGNPIINDPEHTSETDYVVVESTYGNRRHKGLEESIDELAEAVTETFRRGGNVLIPAFAVGRTQDILYILNKLVREGRLSPFNVYVDSPLAEEATKVYCSHPELCDEEAKKLFGRKGGRKALKIHFTGSVEASQKLNRIRQGAVIIAGSGMCEGGRIRHHFKHSLWRPECSIVFTGFQARGTLGRMIVDGAKSVTVLKEKIAVKARVYTIGGFSAHADQRELLEWLGLFRNHPKVFIVHGEENVALDFEKAVKEKLGFATCVPRYGESFEI
ncbi:MAG TPA: MBL fold metallo-hydrolase [Syntrophales bacterium]|jgi:metallo-beta-lactamase family protein|nr:MBL fold metallo-hydrolase [Syntrophales bacterium]